MRAQRNVDAADSEESAELLSPDGAPFCLHANGTTLKCPVTSDRTVRAGVYELKVCLSRHSLYTPMHSHIKRTCLLCLCF